MKYFVILLAVTQVHCQGSEYNIPLLGHGSKGESYTLDVLYQMTLKSGTVDVTIDSIKYPTSTAGTAWSQIIQINETTLPIQSQLKNMTREVTTSIPVNLQVITTKDGHSEGYQAIPNSLLGTEYYVSTFCALGGYCQVVIGSTVPGTTQVYVKLPDKVTEIGFCIVNGTWTSSSDTTITLVYPEVVQLESTHDLTGTRIYSDNPVAVVAGSRRPATNSTPALHLAEQLTPVSSWGTEFYVRPIGVNNYGSIITITSDQRRTYVTMDGFPPVELTGEGMSITRRVERLGVTRIKATRPVQVMMYTGFTYNTNETIVSPGMTLVPATEHYHASYKVACANTVPSDTLQIVRETLKTITGLSTVIATTAVPYRKYSFDEYNNYIVAGAATSVVSSSGSAFSGIMTCGGSAIFPISILTKQTVTGCSPTAAGVALPGDGVDNDCDEAIDEDQCYENRVFRTSYTFANGTFTGEPPHNENITDFTLIKFRLRSCGDVKIELRGTNSSGSVGKLVISIAKEALVIYYCFPNCDSHVFTDTSVLLGQADCSTLVPYWIVKTKTKLCMNTGPFPDFGCSSTPGISVIGHIFTDMFMFGLHSNAVFYYDVYRSDCGGLESNWRCEDKVYNCWEFEDLCNSEYYKNWTMAHCAKFCNYCAPDSVGQVFAVIQPRPGSKMQYNLVPSSSGTFSSVVSGNAYPFITYNAVTKDNITVKVHTSSENPTGVKSVHIVYTSDSSNLIVTAASSSYDRLSIPVYPLDALGTEYMTLSFSETAICDVISPDGPAHVWSSTATATTDQGTIYSLHKQITLNANNYIGTVITADRPVAVFCSYFNGSTQFIDYWAQLLPTSSWGTTYFIPPLDETSTISANVRIVTNSANTRVEIDGDFQAVIILDQRGDYLDQPINPAVKFTFVSNFPIALVVQYMDTTTGGQSVLTVPSAENFMDDAAIYYNDVTERVVFGVASTDLTFISESAESDAAGRLYYSTETSGSFAMSTFNFSSEPGTEVYNHPVRQSSHLVKDLYQMCTVTKATAGDNIDNDCDGLVDEEEVCETGYRSVQEDLDLDGAFGEDCNSTVAPAITLTPPAIPQCYFLDIPDTNESVCYTACLAPCPWVENLNAYKNMTQEEKDASNLPDIQKYIAILKVDEALLQATTNEKESATDSRESSINIGIVGVVMISLICTLIVFFDFVNVIKWFKKKRQTSTAEDLQSQRLAPKD